MMRSNLRLAAPISSRRSIAGRLTQLLAWQSASVVLQVRIGDRGTPGRLGVDDAADLTQREAVADQGEDLSHPAGDLGLGRT